MKIRNTAGEIIKAGCVVIDDQGLVLLITTEQDPTIWAFPKGHAEQGETLEQTAIRETIEETGFEVEISGRLNDLTYISVSAQEPVRVAMFSAKPIKKVGEGSEPMFWKSQSEAKKLLHHNLVQY